MPRHDRGARGGAPRRYYASSSFGNVARRPPELTITIPLEGEPWFAWIAGSFDDEQRIRRFVASTPVLTRLVHALGQLREAA